MKIGFFTFLLALALSASSGPVLSAESEGFTVKTGETSTQFHRSGTKIDSVIVVDGPEEKIAQLCSRAVVGTIDASVHRRRMVHALVGDHARTVKWLEIAPLLTCMPERQEIRILISYEVSEKFTSEEATHFAAAIKAHLTAHSL